MIDHVGYLVRDLEAGLARVTSTFAAEPTRPVDRPQWSLLGWYVGTVEVFTFTDPELLEERLGGAEGRLDHLARAVADLRAEMARLPGPFSGPDLRGEVDEPFDLGGTLHVWTVLDGLGLQLIQYPAQRSRGRCDDE
jgi:catechol 2,3-dioxygenase-like lactoylglutathione lyase family enzyme